MFCRSLSVIFWHMLALQWFESVTHTVKARDAPPDQKHLPSAETGMVVGKIVSLVRLSVTEVPFVLFL